MVGVRKVCVNHIERENIKFFNAQKQQAGEQVGYMHVPEPDYKTASFSFRVSTVLDWFIDPESKDNDIIIFLQHRGELRFDYDPGLEARLTNIFSTFE